jgi:hypothetical protein
MPFVVPIGLVLANGPERTPARAVNVWRDSFQFQFLPSAVPRRSCGHPAQFYSFPHHRRAALRTSCQRESVGAPAFRSRRPAAQVGYWTLISGDRMLASVSCTSRFSNGEALCCCAYQV